MYLCSTRDDLIKLGFTMVIKLIKVDSDIARRGFKKGAVDVKQAKLVQSGTPSAHCPTVIPR